MALQAGRRGVLPSELTPEGKIKGTNYELPVASANTLGGIKVGTGLSMNDGVLSASGGKQFIYITTAPTTGANIVLDIPDLETYDGLMFEMDVNGSSSELCTCSIITFYNKTGTATAGYITSGSTVPDNLSGSITQVARSVIVDFSTKKVTIGMAARMIVNSQGVSFSVPGNVAYVRKVYGIKF